MIAIKAESYLKNYFSLSPASFSYKDFNLHIGFDRENASNYEIVKRQLNQLSETGILTIEGVAHKDELRNIAIEVRYLLSLALGRRIIFDRQCYLTEKGPEVETRAMTNNHIEGYQIVPDFKIGSFLASTIENMNSLTGV